MIIKVTVDDGLIRDYSVLLYTTALLTSFFSLLLKNLIQSFQEISIFYGTLCEVRIEMPQRESLFGITRIAEIE